MTRPSASSAALWALAACAIACQREAPAPAPSASAVAAAAPTPSAAPTESAAPEPQPPCRAIQVTGSVTSAEGPALLRGAPLEGKAWLELAEGSSVVAKDTRSGRELTLRGPGRALPCFGGEERWLVASGGATTSPGVGARAGAVATVATPHGLAQFGDARLEVSVTATQTALRVTKGEVGVESGPGATRKGPERVAAPSGEARLTVARPGATAALDACGKAADEAASAAERVVEPGAEGGLGARAARQFEARQRARNQCSIAAAAVGALEVEARAPAWTSLARAEARWRTVPHPKK